MIFGYKSTKITKNSDNIAKRANTTKPKISSKKDKATILLLSTIRL